MEEYYLIKKLLGPIDPVGDSSIDEERYNNLQKYIKLVDILLFDINSVAGYSSRQEHSMKKAGIFAESFIKSIKEEY